VTAQVLVTAWTQAAVSRCRSAASTPASTPRRVASLSVVIVPVSGSGLAPSAISSHPGASAAPLGLRSHLVVSGARCRGHHHGQHEPQLVAQPLARPVINDPVQILGEDTAPSRQIELPVEVRGGCPGVCSGEFLGDRLATSGRGKARWRHGHGPSGRSDVES